jgi:hypothetical protein
MQVRLVLFTEALENFENIGFPVVGFVATGEIPGVDSGLEVFTSFPRLCEVSDICMSANSVTYP